MSAEATITGTSFVLRRTYDASREEVFAAFTTAERMRRWFAPVAGWEVSHAEVDARPGGSYHLEFGPPGGDPVVERGTYLEFDPPSKLVIEVRLGGAVTEATVTTVEFLDRDGGTELIVSESGYSSEEVARRHAGGWTTMLSNLAGSLEAGRTT